MNTISSIVPFLMVFLIQNTQNRDSTALQLKLDELIRAAEAKNKLIGIERLSEPELESVREKLEKKKPVTGYMTAIAPGIQRTKTSKKNADACAE
jgi:low affinity Fe/Cu permease